jgi:tetratricopeptide (TPR) repeat protein
LFAAVIDLLRAESTSGPLVIVLDDLQWADEASLVLLRHAGAHVADLSVAIVGIYRDTDPPPEKARASLLNGLAQAGRVVHLEGLAVDDVVALVDASPRMMSTDWARRLASRTRGNPFFATEVLRLLGAQGDTGEDPLATVPPSVSSVVMQRLERLPPDVQDVLAVAAVIAEQFTVAQLAAAAPNLPVAEAVEVGASAGLVALAGDGFGFAHALVREAIIASLGPVTVAELHQRIGRALAGTASPEALARHFLAALPLGDEQSAVRHCIAAGEACLDRLAHEDARRWFDRALAVGGPSPSDRIRALLGRAEANRRASDSDAALADFEEVIAADRRDADPRAFALAALGIQRLGYRSGQLHERPAALLEEAAARVPAESGELRAELLSAFALELWSHAWERAEEARARSAEALALAEQTGSAGAIARCLEARYTVSWSPELAAERADIAARMAQHARRIGDGEVEATAELLRATALLERADPRWIDALTRFFEVAAALRLPRLDYMVLTRRAALALLRGDLDAASGLIDEAAALGRRIGEPDAIYADYHLRAELLRFAHERGQLLDRQLPLRTSSVSLFGHVERPVMLLDAGHEDEARDAFEQAARIPIELVKRDWIFLYNLADLAEAAIRLGANDVAARCYETLLPYAGGMCVATALVCFGGAVDHHLGHLALHLGRRREAMAHLDSAASLHDRVGAPGWARASRELLERARAEASASAEREGALARVNKVWRMHWGHDEIHVPDSKGLRDLAALLAAPGAEVAATDLYARDSPGLAPPATSRGEDVIDAAGKAAYRRRLAQLAADLDEADAHHDPARSEALAVERDALLDELRRNFDLRGRPRRLGDVSERARKAVSGRLRAAIGVIESAHGELGAHLRASVRTGTYCSYQPAEPTRWDVRQI